MMLTVTKPSQMWITKTSIMVFEVEVTVKIARLFSDNGLFYIAYKSTLSITLDWLSA